MQYLDNKNKIFELLSQGATVITPNNRLSEKLLHDYYKYQTIKTIDKPRCLPYSTALLQAYHLLLFKKPELAHPIVLNKLQTELIWINSIQNETTLDVNPGLLAQLMQAWEYCQLWEVNPQHPDFKYNEQTLLFQTCWHSVNAHLIENHFITEHQLVPYLIDNSAFLSSTIVWYCFDEFYPQQLSLQKYLKTNKQAQYQYDLPETNTIPELYAAPDQKTEYQQLISWLKVQLQQRKRHIGVVIPNLHQEFKYLQRLLLQHFSVSDFNISLGQNLCDFPLVAHALICLHLDTFILRPHQAALLLESPYIGYANEEFLMRSQALQDMKILQDPSIDMFEFIKDLEDKAPKLAHLLSQITPFPIEASPKDWANLFQDRLTLLGYPGDYTFSSENYQCFQRLESSFAELRQLQLVDSKWSCKEALEVFTTLLEYTIFQAQKPPVPIQISGLLEASGCEFDVLWLAGLTDSCLPQSTHLSAFIPPTLQKSLLMPHSLPYRELKYAKQQLERLKRGCLKAVFSYPRLVNDSPNLPCSLITDYPAYTPLSSNLDNRTSPLVVIEESYAIPLQKEELKSGGTALLANQAKCPFKALAEHRLKAKPLIPINEGIDSRARGELIHKVMELIWRKIQSQDELIQLSAHDLNLSVDEAIYKALNMLQPSPSAVTAIVQDIEFNRIKKLVLDCLEWEKQRVPFTIAALEASFSLELAGFNFQFRVDRIDQVNDNQWIIDYKSTLPITKSWKDERPEEPQLLLYSLLNDYINALLFIQLKSGKLSFSGFSEENTGIAGIAPLKATETWSQYKTYWRDQLSLLAKEFQEGHCPPKPANLTHCHHCDFYNLCRFQED